MSEGSTGSVEHEERFTVRSFDLDDQGRLSVRSLLGFLQDAAGAHADLLGVGLDTLSRQSLAWVLSRLQLEVFGAAELREEIVVLTRPTGFERVLARRDFEVFGARQQRLAIASSAWATVDMTARRAVRPPDWLLSLRTSDKPRLLNLEPRRLDAPQTDRLALQPPAELEVRRSDLDVLGHLNNVRFAELALEAVPEEVWTNRRLSALDLLFRAEASLGDRILTAAEIVDPQQAEITIRHQLARARDQMVLLNAQSRWKTPTADAKNA